jgi:hypothetical protein
LTACQYLVMMNPLETQSESQATWVEKESL